MLSIGVMKTAGWEYYAREVADGLEDYTRGRVKRRVCGPGPARPQPVSPARCRAKLCVLRSTKRVIPGPANRLVVRGVRTG